MSLCWWFDFLWLKCLVCHSSRQLNLLDVILDNHVRFDSRVKSRRKGVYISHACCASHASHAALRTCQNHLPSARSLSPFPLCGTVCRTMYVVNLKNRLSSFKSLPLPLCLSLVNCPPSASESEKPRRCIHLFCIVADLLLYWTWKRGRQNAQIPTSHNQCFLFVRHLWQNLVLCVTS